MFGYVRPALNQLSDEERKQYKSAYCGLCHVMGKRHGFLARCTLNYDFTLLAMLHYAVGSGNTYTCKRCPVHPFRKGMNCLSGTSLETAADQSMILTWYKLCDDIQDRSLIVGLPVRILRRLFRKGYLRAAAARPDFDRNVRLEMGRLKGLEEERTPSIDLTSDTFAKILSFAAEDCDLEQGPKRALELLFYQLGRWIYLADAWDDLKEDIKAGRYNPLDARFSGNALGEVSYVDTTMTHSVRLIESAANLLEFGALKNVIENILFLGLPAVQKAVLEGRWKEVKKQGRKQHERSLRSSWR